MGTDPAGDKIKEHTTVKRLALLLQDKAISVTDKLRLILLYIINKGGTSLLLHRLYVACFIMQIFFANCEY